MIEIGQIYKTNIDRWLIQDLYYVVGIFRPGRDMISVVKLVMFDNGDISVEYNFISEFEFETLILVTDIFYE